MKMLALRQRVALALCPELGRALTEARRDVARLNWLVEERAKLIEHRSRQTTIPSGEPKLPELCRCQGSQASDPAKGPGQEPIPGPEGLANRDPGMREGVSQDSWLGAPATPFVSRPIDEAKTLFRYLRKTPEGYR